MRPNLSMSCFLILFFAFGVFITHATCIAASHWPLGILFWINSVYSNIEQIGCARRTIRYTLITIQSEGLLASSLY